MTRLCKTTNKQYAEETAETLRGVYGPDAVAIHEFEDGAGLKYYEVWLEHTPESCRKA